MTSEREMSETLRRCLNIASVRADVTCDGTLFQKLAPETNIKRLGFTVVEKIKVSLSESYKPLKCLFCYC